MKNIRTENPVTANGVNALVSSYEIVDYAWMVFSSAQNRRSARTAFRSRNTATLIFPATESTVSQPTAALRAARANRVFSTDEKHPY
jgi:hypothetical protein